VVVINLIIIFKQTMDVDFVYFVDMYQGRPAETFVGGERLQVVAVLFSMVQNHCNVMLRLTTQTRF